MGFTQGMPRRSDFATVWTVGNTRLRKSATGWASPGNGFARSRSGPRGKLRALLDEEGGLPGTAPDDLEPAGSAPAGNPRPAPATSVIAVSQDTRILSRTVLDKFRVCRKSHVGRYLRPFPFPCGFSLPASASFLSR